VQQATPPEGYVEHKRFAGVQQALEQQVLRNRELEGTVGQQSQYQQTLETQLRSLQEQMNTQAQQLQQFQTVATEAQRQNQFWTLLSKDFPELVPLATTFRVVDDEAGQRQIFEQARQTIGSVIQRTASQQVANTFLGVTPGMPATMFGAPTPGIPSYAEVMEHVMDDNLAKNNPDEWNRWYQIYQNHPEMNYESLGLGKFENPIPNHYQSRAAHVAQQGQPPQQIPQTPQAPTVPIGSWVPSGPFHQEGGNG
jgi:hypothetical protein